MVTYNYRHRALTRPIRPYVGMIAMTITPVGRAAVLAKDKVSPQ